MTFFFVGISRYPTQTQRTRTLTNWFIHDWGDGEFSVTGWVTQGNEKGDGERMRQTTTSPIQSRIGSHRVQTRSGGVYKLLEPAPGQDSDQILTLFEEIPNVQFYTT